MSINLVSTIFVLTLLMRVYESAMAAVEREIAGFEKQLKKLERPSQDAAKLKNKRQSEQISLFTIAESQKDVSFKSLEQQEESREQQTRQANDSIRYSRRKREDVQRAYRLATTAFRLTGAALGVGTAFVICLTVVPTMRENMYIFFSAIVGVGLLSALMILYLIGAGVYLSGAPKRS